MAKKTEKQKVMDDLTRIFQEFDSFAGPLVSSLEEFKVEFDKWLTRCMKKMGEIVDTAYPEGGKAIEPEVIDDDDDDGKVNTTGVLDGEKKDGEEKGQKKESAKKEASEDDDSLPFTDEELYFAERGQVKEWVEECSQIDENIHEELPDLNSTNLPEIKDAIAEFYDFEDDWNTEKRRQELLQYKDETGCNVECLKEGQGCIYDSDERDDLPCWSNELTDDEKAITLELDEE